MITSTIEIAAPPAKVRDIVRSWNRLWSHGENKALIQFRSQFLNFSAYPEWHTEWLKEIQVKDSKKTPQTLSSGDQIEVNIENFKFVAEVKVNNRILTYDQGQNAEEYIFRRTVRTCSLGRARLSSPSLVCINSIWSQPTTVHPLF